MRKPKSEYAIQTVVNAMRLLEAFRDEEELGVTEISRRLGLHKNNVFRLLATLEQQGTSSRAPTPSAIASASAASSSGARSAQPRAAAARPRRPGSWRSDSRVGHLA